MYASHVLEHLAQEDFHKALENTKRILTGGGLFRLVVPDLEFSARKYVKQVDAGDPKANDFFIRATNLGEEKRARGLTGSVYAFLRTSRHLWMWDALSLERALAEHDFHQIRRCKFGDCEDPMFNLVEEESRFNHAVAMEARR